MTRFGRNSLILLGIGLVTLAIGAQAILADDGDGVRPFLGVNLSDGDGEGARIEDVISNTAAERGGLRAGDVIVGFDGAEIESSRDLTREVLRSEAGRRVDVEILRDGRRETISVELGEREGFIGHFGHRFDDEEFAERMERLGERLGEMDFHFEFDVEGLEELREHLGQMRFEGPGRVWAFRSGRPLLGVELVDVTPELREHLGADRDEGVLIGRVIDETPAEEAGIEVGDLLVAIDGEPIEDVGDLRRALRDRRGETFGLDVIRDGRLVGLTVVLPDPEGEEEDGASGSSWPRRPDRPAPSAADRT